jgi:hypothetical protein
LSEAVLFAVIASWMPGGAATVAETVMESVAEGETVPWIASVRLPPEARLRPVHAPVPAL